MELISNVKTMTNIKRIEALHTALKTVHAENIEGSFVECGVWKGGNIIIAKKFFDSIGDKREVIAYDTFTGMTPPTEKDGKKANDKFADVGDSWCESPLEEVKSYISKYDIDLNEIRFVVGDVCKTLYVEKNIPNKISILRLDTDFYDSTLAELDVLYPRLVKGGYLILDDYGHWEGCKKAVDEYFGEQYVKKHFEVVDKGCVMVRV